jgi:3-oxoacyl-[acyl-carrier-protein] synthase-1
MTGATVLATSALCAAGFGAGQVWATARSRVSRVRNSSVLDAHLEPVPMGLVPEEALDPDDEELDCLALPVRARRMLRLASPPLRELVPKLQEKPVAPRRATGASRDSLRCAPVALYLGLPELSPELAPWIETLAGHLFERVGLELDTAASRIFPLGRAAALVALEQALSAVSTDPGRPILVGGVDTYLDLRLLATLGAEGRIHGPRVMDGFVPGEGAAFLWIQATSNSPHDAGTRIEAAASATDPGHRYGSEPARGEGLAEAVEALRNQLPPSSGPGGPMGQPVATIFSGLNGESFEAKSWGVARLRHKDFFTPQASLEHPADCFGDTGAATGAIFTAMADVALSKGNRSGPALIWAASDHGSRGCTLITATTATGN